MDKDYFIAILILIVFGLVGTLSFKPKASTNPIILTKTETIAGAKIYRYTAELYGTKLIITTRLDLGQIGEELAIGK